MTCYKGGIGFDVPAIYLKKLEEKINCNKFDRDHIAFNLMQLRIGNFLYDIPEPLR